MEQKKEYVAPEMDVVDMEYTQMLCDSTPTIGCDEGVINCPEGEGG
ncbi:MAG: hypothetical protein IKN70_02035 [Fibrobacter sp.]|nr:hypothetical protein [Fibrobacter sp.]MBO7062344.1 hypothetical protein [Fibrobacter sp.]MBO7104495.1 hypothetical protein [Fibrobacter sp.]MBR3668778.1 hypothetical protein [Fibrobacter sp.]